MIREGMSFLRREKKYDSIDHANSLIPKYVKALLPIFQCYINDSAYWTFLIFPNP